MTNSMNSLDMAHSTEYYLVCVPAIVREQCGSPQIPRLLARGRSESALRGPGSSSMLVYTQPSRCLLSVRKILVAVSFGR